MSAERRRSERGPGDGPGSPGGQSTRSGQSTQGGQAGRPGASRPRGAGGAGVSVAVITRDRRDSLLRTLDRLAALPERPPVIVVDNGSRDGTAAAVRAHPVGARLLSPGRNTGALGRNLAVQHADTPYVAFSDDDSWWEPGALRAAVGLLDAHPRLGLLAARTLVGPDRAEDPLNTVLARSPLPARPGLPGRPILGFLACACVVRTTAFLAAGGYHPLIFFGGEETLLAYDLAARGWDVCYAPSLTAHHHPSPSQRRGRHPALLRNALLTTWLRRPLRVAAAHTTRLVADATRGDPAAATALRTAAARLPAALRQRRLLPPELERAVRLLDGDSGDDGDGDDDSDSDSDSDGPRTRRTDLPPPGPPADLPEGAGAAGPAGVPGRARGVEEPAPGAPVDVPPHARRTDVPPPGPPADLPGGDGAPGPAGASDSGPVGEEPAPGASPEAPGGDGAAGPAGASGRARGVDGTGRCRSAGGRGPGREAEPEGGGGP